MLQSMISLDLVNFCKIIDLKYNVDQNFLARIDNWSSTLVDVIYIKKKFQGNVENDVI